MTWFKVDDGFWSHPKTVGLSDSAVALWVRAGAYACQHLTDGAIATPVLRMVGDKDAAAELVTAGLWNETAGGFVFHDWAEYQETSEAVKERRTAARDRQRKSRAAREAKRAEREANSGESSQPVTPDVTRDNTREFSTPDPTRPDHKRDIRPPVFDVATDRAAARESGGEVVTLRPPRGGLEVAARWNETGHSAEAHAIARQYEKHAGTPVPGEVLSGVAQRIDECLQSGIEPEQIARGLIAWHDSPIGATSQIPSFVHKAGRTAASKPTGVGKPTQKAQSIQAAGEAVIAQMRGEK